MLMWSENLLKKNDRRIRICTARIPYCQCYIHVGANTHTLPSMMKDIVIEALPGFFGGLIIHLACVGLVCILKPLMQ